MGTKPIEGFKRRDTWDGLPTAVVIAGHDTDETIADNPLVDEESNAVTDESLEPLVAAMEATGGFLGTIDGARIGGEVYAVNGRRRTRALRILNNRRTAKGLEPFTLSVKLVTVDPKNRNLGLFAAVCTLNEHSRSKTPYERCRQAIQMQKYGAGVDDIAAIFGVTRAAVHNWLNISETSPKVQQAIASGKVPAASASTLKRLPEKTQDEVIAETLAESANERAKAAAIDRKATEKEPDKAPPKALRRGKKELLRLMGMATEKAADKLYIGEFSGPGNFRQAFVYGVRWACGDLTDADIGFDPSSVEAPPKAVPPVVRKRGHKEPKTDQPSLGPEFTSGLPGAR